MTPTIGLAMIVKNEHEVLEQALNSIKGIDEIVICDTGSIDNTVEIAKKYTDKVYTDYIWEDSFCKARNYAKSKMTTDWILSLDADETLHSYPKLREAVLLAEQRGLKAIDCTMIASDNGTSFLFPRVFKNIPEVFWNGNIHNHLSILGEQIGDVRITHGYSPAHQYDPDRAFRILKKEVETRPDAIREMFYLGREYFYKKDYKNALINLGKYVQKSNHLAEKAEAFLIMARSYKDMGEWEDARDACLQAIKLNAHFKEALVFMSVLAGKGTGNEQWERNAAQWLRLAETADNGGVLFTRTNFDFR